MLYYYHELNYLHVLKVDKIISFLKEAVTLFYIVYSAVFFRYTESLCDKCKRFVLKDQEIGNI